MQRTLIIIAILFLSSSLSSQIHTVKQDGTGDYMLIQDAVDACSQGDTVLVYPGIYFENIEINLKNLTLASLNILDNNPIYKYNTIIDGGGVNQGSCVWSTESTEFILYGFTIQNGTGRELIAGGTGGGLFISKSNASIVNCIIKNNYARYNAAGIYSNWSNLYLSGTTIKDNYSATTGGGGLVFYISEDTAKLVFDTVNLCSIYNNHACYGADIFIGRYVDSMTIKLDTFSVSQPGRQHLYSVMDNYFFPSDRFVIDMNSYITESVNNDLYVSPSGDDLNSGTSEDEPLKSLTKAIYKIVTDSVKINTIHLDEGIYSPTSTGEYFPLGLWSNIKLVGDDKTTTILDAENNTHHFSGKSLESTIELRNLSLRNGMGDYSKFLKVGSIILYGIDTVLIKNVSFNGNTGYSRSSLSIGNCSQVEIEETVFENNVGGKALSISSGYFSPEVPRLTDSVSIKNTIFKNNIPNPDSAIGYGGALLTFSIGDLYSDSLLVQVTNCLFVDNESDHGSYPSSIVHNWHQSHTVFTNCTFSNNYSNENQYSGTLAVSGYYGKSEIYNSVFYNDFPREIYLGSNEDTCKLGIFNSNIDGGIDKIGGDLEMNQLFYDTSNINADPLFLGSWGHPYQIRDNSPCIDAGSLDSLPEFIMLPEEDLAGNLRIYGENIDMGAYEWDPTIVGVIDNENLYSNIILVASPNPFQDFLDIEVDLPIGSLIELSVYNSMGDKIFILFEGEINKSPATFNWYAEKQKGVCFIVLNYEGKNFVRKVISL